MYATSLRKEFQVRRFIIRHRSATGWEVVEESDSRILKRSVYRDWHRVERAIAQFEQEEATLEAAGWIKVAS